MKNDDEWQSWMVQLAEGNPEAEHEFWNLYGERLQRLASQNLSSGLRRRVGAEDVVQSACRTFLRRAQDGQFEFFVRLPLQKFDNRHDTMVGKNGQ